MVRSNKKRQFVTSASNPQRRAQSSKHNVRPKQRAIPGRNARPQPIVPFDAKDDLLLVGEGDFSFSHSLLVHHTHRFRSLTATTFETRTELLNKHPQAEATIHALSSAPSELSLADGSGATLDTDDGVDEAVVSDSDFEGFSDEAADDATEGNMKDTLKTVPSTPASPGPRCTVLYSVDATKLSKAPVLRRKIRRFTRIIFNFPHVGGKASGKSTDVNRQVRYNQQLLHSFFGECKSFLKRPARAKATGCSSSSVLVTLFEGEPYTLWNVRDLARSAGLEVKRSWAFDWALYPGYRHARTLGNLGQSGGRGEQDAEEEQKGHNGKGGSVKSSQHKRKDGWKGEERPARTYEFGLKGAEAAQKRGNEKKRKKAEDDSSSDEM